MDHQQIQEEIIRLIHYKIDLITLEEKSNQLKQYFNVIDPTLIAELNSKLLKGKEFFSNCQAIIGVLEVSELQEKDINTISELVDKVKQLLIEFPELERLEQVKHIPKWIKKLYEILIISQKNTKNATTNISEKQQSSNILKEKSISEITQIISKAADDIDPISISPRLKQSLSELLLDPLKIPSLLDRNLNELALKLKLILWIKEAFDIMGKDVISYSEVDNLIKRGFKQEQIEKFKQLKYKYECFKTHIQEMQAAQESWITGSNNLLLQIKSSTDILEQGKDMSGFEVAQQKQKLKQLKSKLTTHLKSLSDKIEKVSEVKKLFYELTSSMEWIYWTLEAIDLLSSESQIDDSDSIDEEQSLSNNGASQNSNSKLTNNNPSSSFGQMIEDENSLQTQKNQQKQQKKKTKAKQLQDLSIMYKKAIDCKIPKNSYIFLHFELIYSKAQNYLIKSELLQKARDTCTSTKYQENLPIYVNFEANRTQKPTLKQVEEFYVDLQELANYLDVQKELDQFGQELQRSQSFTNRSQKLIKIYMSTLNLTPVNDFENQMQVIEQELCSLNEELYYLPIYLEDVEEQLFTFEWRFFCISLLLGYKKQQSFDVWGQLFTCYQILQSSQTDNKKNSDSTEEIDINKQILTKISAELMLYKKIEDSINQLKESEKMSRDQRHKEARKLRSLKEVQSLKSQAILNCLVDVTNQLQFVESIIEIGIQKQEAYKTFIANQDDQKRKSLNEWKNLLDVMRKNCPIAVDEEFIVEEIINQAEQIEKMIQICNNKSGKCKTQIHELINRYQLSKVYNQEAEIVIKAYKQKEEIISSIENQIFYNSNNRIVLNNKKKNNHKSEGDNKNFDNSKIDEEGQISNDDNKEEEDEEEESIIEQDKLIDLQQKLEGIRQDFSEDRVKMIDDELFLRKIILLKHIQENEGDAQGAGYSDMQKLLHDLEVRIQNSQENSNSENDIKQQRKKQEALQFLQNICSQCHKRLDEVKKITDLKKLNFILNGSNNKALCHISFVDLTPEIKKHYNSLKEQLKQEEELERAMEKEATDKLLIKSSKQQKKQTQNKFEEQSKKNKTNIKIQKCLEEELSQIFMEDDDEQQSNNSQEKETKYIPMLKKQIQKQKYSQEIKTKNQKKKFINSDIELDEETDSEQIKKSQTHNDHLQKKHHQILKNLEKKKDKLQHFKDLHQSGSDSKGSQASDSKNRLFIRKTHNQIHKYDVEQQRQKIRTNILKKKIITNIAKMMAGNPTWDLSIEDAMQGAKNIVVRVMLLTHNKLEKTIEICTQITDLFDKLNDYPSISTKMEKQGFSWKYISELLDKNDKYLMQEDRKEQMSNYLANNEDDEVFSMKIKRKCKVGQTGERQNPMSSILELVSSQSNNYVARIGENDNNKQNNKLQQMLENEEQNKEEKNNLNINTNSLQQRKHEILQKRSIIKFKKSQQQQSMTIMSDGEEKNNKQHALDQNNSQTQMEQSEDCIEIANPQIAQEQSDQNNKQLSLLPIPGLNYQPFQKRNYLNNKFNKFNRFNRKLFYNQSNATFSDDEDNIKQKVEPLTELEIQDYKQFIQKQEIRIQKNNTKEPILYDPEATQNANNNNNLNSNANSDQKSLRSEESTQVTYSIGSYDMNADGSTFEGISFLSLQIKSDLSRLPVNKDKILSVSGKLSKLRVEEYYISILDLVEKQSKEVVFAGGWLESTIPMHNEALTQYADFLKLKEKIAVIEWNQECKFYLMHTDQIAPEWHQKACFDIKDNSKQVYKIKASCVGKLMFFVIYKSYKLQSQQIKNLTIQELYNNANKKFEQQTGYKEQHQQSQIQYQTGQVTQQEQIKMDTKKQNNNTLLEMLTTAKTPEEVEKMAQNLTEKKQYSNGYNKFQNQYKKGQYYSQFKTGRQQLNYKNYQGDSSINNVVQLNLPNNQTNISNQMKALTPQNLLHNQYTQISSQNSDECSQPNLTLSCEGINDYTIPNLSASSSIPTNPSISNNQTQIQQSKVSFESLLPPPQFDLMPNLLTGQNLHSNIPSIPNLSINLSGVTLNQQNQQSQFRNQQVPQQQQFNQKKTPQIITEKQPQQQLIQQKQQEMSPTVTGLNLNNEQLSAESKKSPNSQLASILGNLNQTLNNILIKNKKESPVQNITAQCKPLEIPRLDNSALITANQLNTLLPQNYALQIPIYAPPMTTLPDQINPLISALHHQQQQINQLQKQQEQIIQQPQKQSQNKFAQDTTNQQQISKKIDQEKISNNNQRINNQNQQQQQQQYQQNNNNNQQQQQQKQQENKKFMQKKNFNKRQYQLLQQDELPQQNKNSQNNKNVDQVIPPWPHKKQKFNQQNNEAIKEQSSTSNQNIQQLNNYTNISGNQQQKQTIHHSWMQFSQKQQNVNTDNNSNNNEIQQQVQNTNQYPTMQLQNRTQNKKALKDSEKQNFQAHKLQLNQDDNNSKTSALNKLSLIFNNNPNQKTEVIGQNINNKINQSKNNKQDIHPKNFFGGKEEKENMPERPSIFSRYQ